MKEIKKQEYDYALNVLPPRKMEGTAFMLGEPFEIDRFASFDYINGKYWFLGRLTPKQFDRWVKYKILI